MMKPTFRWRKMARFYRELAEKDYNHAILDFSDEAAQQMFDYESRGIGDASVGIFPNASTGKYNGYAVGKKLLDITLAMWLEDLRSGLLFLHELEGDIPKWLFDRVVKALKRGGGRNGQADD